MESSACSAFPKRGEHGKLEAGRKAAENSRLGTVGVGERAVQMRDSGNRERRADTAGRRREPGGQTESPLEAVRPGEQARRKSSGSGEGFIYVYEGSWEEAEK